jgi:hypothetical protein
MEGCLGFARRHTAQTLKNSYREIGRKGLP